MKSGGKTSWRDLAVHGLDAGSLTEPEKLAALYRFRTGEAPPGLYVVVGDPEEVDWAGFPEVLALEAVTQDELRRLCKVLRADLPVPAEDLPTPPRGFDWSFYLGKVSVSPV